MIIAANHKQLRQALRSKFRSLRKALSSSEQIDGANSLVEHCQQLALFEGSQHVAIYFTNDGELDTGPLINYLWAQKINVYLPVIHPFCAGHLLFLHYTQNTQMKENRFGIAEPELTVSGIIPLTKLNILFTPIVAFDDIGNRLGMGGGFYDRTLNTLFKYPNKTSPQVIGLAHEVQKSPKLPTEAWDIQIPHILTPTQSYTFT